MLDCLATNQSECLYLSYALYKKKWTSERDWCTCIAENRFWSAPANARYESQATNLNTTRKHRTVEVIIQVQERRWFDILKRKNFQVAPKPFNCTPGLTGLYFVMSTFILLLLPPPPPPPKKGVIYITVDGAFRSLNVASMSDGTQGNHMRNSLTGEWAGGRWVDSSAANYSVQRKMSYSYVIVPISGIAVKPDLSLRSN